MMQSGNVVAAMEYQERAKMANWELVEVTKAICDECESIDSCNVYRTPHGCICLKCLDRKREVYAYAYICGGCMGKWLKSRDMDID